MIAAGEADDRAFFGHPRGLGWLSFTEFWERFSYYGMQALLVLYMTHRLLLPGHVERVWGFPAMRAALEAIYGHLTPQALGSVIFGFYAGLVYVTPIAGGLLADRLLGRTRTVVLGALLMAVGHFLMASETTFLFALLFLLLGAGCFKGNLATQVAGLYSPGDHRTADAFQLYYVAINLAVVAAPLVCGTLGERYGYHWGFGAAGVGMLLGLLIYLKGRRWLPREAGHGSVEPKQPADGRNRGGASTVGRALSSGDRRLLLLMTALVPVLGLSLVGNFQIFNAYLLWAESTCRLRIFGMDMPVSWLLSIDCFISIVLLAASMMFWRWWGKHRREPDEVSKMVLGAFLMACAPLALAAAAKIAVVSGQKVSLLWILPFEFFNDFGYANVVPVGLALYSHSAPKALGGMMTGAYYVLFFFANMTVGWLGGLLERISGSSFWLIHAAIVFGAALVLLAMRRPLIDALFAVHPTPMRSPGAAPEPLASRP